MGWTTTIAALLGAFAVGLWARARSARPRVPGEVRYVPYTGVLFIAVLAIMLMLAHLLTLAGVNLPAR